MSKNHIVATASKNRERLSICLDNVLKCMRYVDGALNFEDDVKYRDLLYRMRYDLFTLFNYYQSLYIERMQDSYNDLSNFINEHYENGE